MQLQSVAVVFSQWPRYDEILPRVLAKGYTQQQLNTCLDEYDGLEVLQVSHDRASITFL